MSRPDYNDPDWTPLGKPAEHCHYSSTDQPGIGHCYWCADGGLCPLDAPAAADVIPAPLPAPEAP